MKIEIPYIDYNTKRNVTGQQWIELHGMYLYAFGTHTCEIKDDAKGWIDFNGYWETEYKKINIAGIEVTSVADEENGDDKYMFTIFVSGAGNDAYFLFEKLEDAKKIRDAVKQWLHWD